MLPIGVYRAFWNEIFHEPERIKQGCRFAALFLDEFKKAYGNLSKPIEAPTTGRRLDDSLDEFPAGYSLTGLLSSTRASASPAGGEYALGLTQLRGSYKPRKYEGNETKTGSDSTLENQILCPKDGVHLTAPKLMFLSVHPYIGFRTPVISMG
jgi:hypothetical protein